MDHMATFLRPGSGLRCTAKMAAVPQDLGQDPGKSVVKAPPPTAIRDVSARGARIRFVEAGSGPPLLLVHGWLSSHLVWMDVLPHLAERFRVIVPDLPGF